MENQDQRKIHAPENHVGVHLCHKCGWPFPNPHPSAKHRRAHKRLCGKIEGHKLIDSEGSNHSTLSDDEHVSDDDNKSLSPVIVETVKTEKGIDESKENLKKSEEEVFSDAGSEFSDSKPVGNTKDSASILEMDKKEELKSSQSFKDCEISDLVPLQGTLTDKIMLHDPEVGQSTVDELQAGAENTRSQPSPNIPTDNCIDRENMDFDSNVAVETNQPELKIEEIIERASDPIATEEVSQLKEGDSAFMAFDVAAKSCSSDYLVESNDGGGEDRNKNVLTLSVLDDLSISDQALLKDFKDHEGVKVEQLENTDSIKGMKEGEDESFVGKPLDELPVREPDAEATQINSLEEENSAMVEELLETDRKDIDSVSDSSRSAINSNTHDGEIEREDLEPSLGPINEESLIRSSATMEENTSAEVGGPVLISEPLQVEDDKIIDKPGVIASSNDVLADTSSQADSVDATWGSVLSGLSIRSDAPAVVECNDIPQTLDHAAAGAKKTDGTMPKSASQNSEKSDAFEPPSFTSLVEQGGEGGRPRPNAADSEIQNTKEPQAGWFPSFTPVSSDSDGRKKNEELIAKVTSWKAGKQHTPLKNLLGEAAIEAKPENLPPSVQDDKKTSDTPTTGETETKMHEKEWDSPARLPEEIKEKKKKGKGRPYWAQFVCCTSANY